MNEKLKTILLVDDSPSNIDFLKNTLKDTYNITAATSGQQALKILEKNPAHDMILLDVIMPEMDGYEVCKIVKSDPAIMNIPIIFVTVLNEEQDEAKGLELGAVDYITKPINEAITKARVKTHLMLSDQKQLLEQRIRKEIDEHRELRAVNEKLELALLAADAGTFTHHYEHDVVRLDERASHHLHSENKDISFDEFFKLIHPEDAPVVGQLLHKSFASQEKYITVGFRAAAKQHKITEIQVQALIEYDSETEKPIRSIGVVFDITERKRAEQEKKDAKERLDFVLSSGNMAKWEYHVEDDRFIASEMINKIWGFAPDEEIDLEKAFLKIHPDDL